MHDTLTIVGNIASDPSHIITQSGLSILNFRLASNHRRFDPKTNSWIETDPNFFNVSAFRRLADNGKLSLARGDAIIVTGRLRVREWENNGKRGTSVDIEADAIGPDLRWGTVRYARTSKTGQSGDSALSENGDTVPLDEQWMPPGLSEQQFGENLDERSNELVAVGIGAGDDDSAPTPF